MHTKYVNIRLLPKLSKFYPNILTGKILTMQEVEITRKN